MTQAEQRIVTVFAKEPRPGQVKTRLSPTYSPQVAAEFAEAMLADTLEKLGTGTGFELQLAVAPADAVGRMREEFPGIQVVAQEGAGLGGRMAQHFASAFARAPQGLFVIVGSDAPQMPLARISEAFEALAAGARLVLGPDEGGGYYLVGMRAGVVPELFTAIEMSTGTMCEQTLALAHSLDLPVQLLPRGYDLDHPADLERLEQDLSLEDTPLHVPRRVTALLEASR